MAPAPTVIAHRGAREAARENTLPAFRLAREFGAEWVELDVRRTADGVAVVHHDAQLDDGRLVADLTVEELPEFVPSLAEALEECQGMGVNIEIKNLPSDPDYDAEHLVSDAVAGLVQAYLGPENALVSSFNIDALDRLHAVDPTIPLAYLFDIGDPVYLLAFIFSGGDAPACLTAADVNADGAIDIADPVSALGVLFNNAAPPSSPHPNCGASLAPLGCSDSACP